jgi:PhoPQ-activated pathogenicity-related protein
MQRRIIWTAVLAAAMWARLPGAFADLASYIARPEPQYHWEKSTETQQGFITVTDLKLRSQVWRDIPWDHTLRIYRPVAVKYPKTALLLITGGNPGGDEAQLASVVVSAAQAPVAILYNIPNQPLFGNKTEDTLIAYTYEEYLKSGDDTWPLLEPMTKSAVKAMDALQAFSDQEWHEKIEQFVVIGASKRGWTTYLTGASDPRVKAIIPIVFDSLHLEEQMPHQLALWGAYSEEIQPYTRLGIQQELKTRRGRRLVRLVDPWYYRGRLKMPKLLINGANDRYWPTDATSLYWDDLPGEKSLLYVPNSGHKIEDVSRVITTAVAFFRHVAGDTKFPRLTFENSGKGDTRTLRIRSSVKPTEARLWVAHSDSFDLRDSKWESSPMRTDGEAFVGDVSVPQKGSVAWFGELVFAGPAGPYVLSTPSHIAPNPVSRSARRELPAARNRSTERSPARAG